MVRELAPGLPADWLNAWLAAIGITVLDEDIRLAWSDDEIPLAIFDHPGDSELPDRIARALPDEEWFSGLVMASCPRNVSLAAFRSASQAARQLWDDSVAFSVTDLTGGTRFRENDLDHGALDPPAPRGSTLTQRAQSCRRILGGRVVEAVGGTLAGTGMRVESNGLGFDIRRIPIGVQGAKPMVDPVIEVLCFASLRLFPHRGNGRQAAQRGWSDAASRPSAFTWPVWSEALDLWGIDALLDHHYAKRAGRSGSTGPARGVFASVPYQRKADMDTTRAYGSMRVL